MSEFENDGQALKWELDLIAWNFYDTLSYEVYIDELSELCFKEMQGDFTFVYFDKLNG